MRRVLAAIALTVAAGAAHAQEPLRFRAPELVVAIVYDEFTQVRSEDRLTSAIRDRYFDGFAAILDRACRFLPPGTYSALRTRIDEVSAGGGRHDGVIANAAAAGIADGRTFTDRFGCDHSKVERAQRHLAAFLGTSAQPRQPSAEPRRARQPRAE